jgi:hypothetical protein
MVTGVWLPDDLAAPGNHRGRFMLRQSQLAESARLGGAGLLFALLLHSLFDHGSHARLAWQALQAPRSDPVLQCDEALQPLRPVLGDARQVAFVSDREDTGPLYCTQFALSPTLVLRFSRDRMAEADWVVGVFADPSHAPATAAEAGLVIDRSLPRGIVLMRQADSAGGPGG